MSQINQLMATLAVGFVLAVALMWTVERDTIKGRPHHRTTSAEVQKTLSDIHGRTSQPHPI